MSRSIRSRRGSAVRPAVEAVEPRRLMASIVVTNNNDSGPGSLRAAITAAASNDTIDLTSRTGTITLAAPLNVSRAVSIVGPGTDLLAISGNDVTGGFGTYNGSAIAISGLTLSHFAANPGGGGGGAISSFYTTGASFILDHVNFKNNRGGSAGFAPAVSMMVAGSVAMVDCAVTDNTGAGSGGGVYVYQGQFTALRCTFTGNKSTGGGAGLLLSSDTIDRLANCTIANNTADGTYNSFTSGAGMSCYSNGKLTMTNCTVVNNKSINVGNSIMGGGLYVQLPSNPAGKTAILTNTIVANNMNGIRGDVYVYTSDPTLFRATNCLIGDGSTSGVTDGVAGNIVGTHAAPIDAHVGTLANYGGATPTVPLLPGSPAIDAGTPIADSLVVPATDQRGFVRLGNTDIGALEAQPGPPVFIGAPLTAATGSAAYSYTIKTLDPNDDPIAITAGTLPGWLTLIDNGDGTAILAGTPTDADIGTVAVMLDADDGSLSSQQSFDLVVVHSPAAPTFTSTPVTTAVGGATYRYDISTIDFNGDPIDINLDTTVVLPVALVDHHDGTATLSGTLEDRTSGPWHILLTASDGTRSSQQSFDLMISHSPAAPVFGTSPSTHATARLQYYGSFTATDANNDALAFTAITKPAWLTFTDNGNGTATLVGVPADGDAGAESIVVNVSDGTDTTQQSYTLTVAPANRAPGFANVALPNAKVGLAYQQTIRATDADGDALTLSANGLPAWLGFTDNGDGTATLAGTPTSADLGSVSLNVSVSDGQTNASINIGFTVVPRPVGIPTFTSTPDRNAYGGQTYSATVTAQDPNGDPLRFTLDNGPSWLNLSDHGDGTATLAGMPTATDFGLPNVSVSVSNGIYSKTQQFTISVALFAGFAGVAPGGHLLIIGTNGADEVTVWRRGNIVRAYRGDDYMNFSAAAVQTVFFVGLDGDDVFQSNVGIMPVSADGGGGNDTIFGSYGNDTLRGSAGDDVIYGGEGRDSIYGDDGDDRLAGNEDADTLFGGDGGDILDGGAGRDLLRGEGGRDRFYAMDGYGDRILGGLPGEGDRAWTDRRDIYADVKLMLA